MAQEATANSLERMRASPRRRTGSGAGDQEPSPAHTWECLGLSRRVKGSLRRAAPALDSVRSADTTFVRRFCIWTTLKRALAVCWIRPLPVSQASPGSTLERQLPEYSCPCSTSEKGGEVSRAVDRCRRSPVSDPVTTHHDPERALLTHSGRLPQAEAGNCPKEQGTLRSREQLKAARSHGKL